jgi:hypothetical protein
VWRAAPEPADRTIAVLEPESEPEPLSQPEPVPEAATASRAEAVPEPEPSIEPEPYPEPEPMPTAAREPESPPAWESEPAPHPAAMAELEAEPEPAAAMVESQADGDSVAPAGEPELVVTETMAEIFLRQGYRELALAVYTQLTLRDPGNARIASAASALQEELHPPAPAPEPEPPAPAFGAGATGGRSVGALFGALLAAQRPAVATTVHPPAFEPPRRAGGEPTRPAQDALSLSAVFGDEAAPAGPAAGPADSAQVGPSFDEFFAPGSSSGSELPRPPGSETGAAASQVPEDLEQFNAWLRGLKR